MFIEWLLLLLREARTYCVNVLRMIFRPSAYAETIVIGDRHNFHGSMNFFLGSISVYIAICGFFLLFGAGDTALKHFPGADGTSFKYIPDEIVAFTRILFGSALMGLLCYLPIFILRRRTFRLVDFVHSWVHVSVAGFYIGLTTVVIVALFLPPVSDESYEIVTKSNMGNLKEFCESDREGTLCRFTGAAISLGIFAIKSSVQLKLIALENTATLQSLMISVVYAYILAFPLLLIISLLWLIRVQCLIMKKTLNISMVTSVGVMVYSTIFLYLMVFAFPNIAPILLDSDVAKDTERLYKQRNERQ